MKSVFPFSRTALLAAGLMAHAAAAPAAVNDVIVNEYNAVSGSDYLGGAGNASKTDSTFGRAQGNGQNWMELLVVNDHTNLQGYQLQWSYNKDGLGVKTGSGTLTFSNDPLWSDVRQGTIISISEWQEVWYKPTGVNTERERTGGVNGLGHLRNNAFNPINDQRVELASDLRWSPELNDWNIHVFAGERTPTTGDYRYLTFTGSVTEDGGVTNSTLGLEDAAGLFATNNDAWQITIKDASNSVVQGPIGEGVAGWGGGGINSGEVGKLESSIFDTAPPLPTEATYRTAVVGHYKDGSTSTFGAANVSTGFVQDTSQLQAWFSAASLVARNSAAASVFSDGTKWAGGLVPDSTQQAIFNQGSASAYTITFNTAADSSRLLVRNDKVTFDLGGNTYNVNSTADFNPSIVVGESSGQNGQLTITNGTLAGAVADIAQRTGSAGSITVTGAGTSLALSRALFIGGDSDRAGGTGTVSVGSNTTVTVGSTLKVFATGLLTLTGGAVTIGSGTVETTPDTIRIHPTGVLDIRGGAVSATSIQLSGGTLSGYGTLSTPVNTVAGGTVFVPQYDDGQFAVLTLSGPISGSSASAFNKIGEGVLQITAAPTYTGDTTVTQGVINYSISSGSVSVGPAATLTILPGATVNVGGNVDPFSSGGNRTNIVNHSTSSFNITAGSKTVGAITGVGNTNVSNDSDLTAKQIVQNNLTINGTAGNPNAKVTLDNDGATPNPNGVLNTLTSLTMANDGGASVYGGPFRTFYSELDLKDNNLAIRAPAGTGQTVWTSDILPGVLTGFNNGAFGNKGITSSTAPGAGNTALAAILNDDGFGNVLFGSGADIGAGSGQTEFDSLGALTIDDILIKYTYYGDLDLSGQVDGLDQALMDIFFGSVAGGWLFGDIDYNGFTDGLDQALLDIFFGNGTGGGFGDPLNGGESSGAAIPEPSSFVLVAPVLLLIARRRRRTR